ncbi:MAG: serine hydrolase domain-containing protein [Bacteroidota bacterium]
MKHTIALILLTYVGLASAQAPLTDSQTKKIDSLFIDWTEGSHPGGAIGIMRKGEVIYSKAFGQASLEYEVPNTVETVFNIGSVSKQFTAMGIVLLQERGLLSVDDDIRKYLPDLPDFGHTITIGHMIHHTSGMRSLHAMLGLAGWRDDDSRTNEDLYRFMRKQKELNFIPGEEYLYCNTGYMLMVNIIENVTKEKFPQWMAKNIFEPLGMRSTYVEDRYDRVVPNNATSYYGTKGEFFRAVEFWGYVGSGNVHSTTGDLLRWLQHFHTPSAEWKSAFESMKTMEKLNDGSKNNYAYGLFIDKAKGYNRIQHGGVIGGFRAFASTYPTEQLNIVVLTNFSSANPRGMERGICDVLLEDKSESSAETKGSDLSADAAQYSMAQLTGEYEVQPGIVANIFVKNDSLYVLQRWDDVEYVISHLKGNIYEMSLDKNIKFVFHDLKDQKTQKLTVQQVGNDIKAKRLVKIDLSTVDIGEYAGRFYSPELGSTYDIIKRGDALIAYHPRHGEFAIEVAEEDALVMTNFASIDVVRNSENTITGIKISNGRARNVWFEKQRQDIE